MRKKTCKICHKSKPFTDFHRHSKMRDGLRAECKVCRSYLRLNKGIKPTKELPRKGICFHAYINGRRHFRSPFISQGIGANRILQSGIRKICVCVKAQNKYGNWILSEDEFIFKPSRPAGGTISN